MRTLFIQTGDRLGIGQVAVKPSEHKIQPLLLDESIVPEEELEEELEDEEEAATHIKKIVLQRD